MYRSTVSLKAGQRSSNSETERYGDPPYKALIRTPYSLPTPDMLNPALGRCQNPWGAQSSRRAPAHVMVPVAGAPYAPGALLCLCLSSPQGSCVACFLFSGDSARPQPEVARGCIGGAVCVGKMLVLESTEGTGSASCPLRCLWEGQLTQEY